MAMNNDMVHGNIYCTNHPYQNNSPGAICAFCLKEKLGKLISSSFPSSIFPSSSPSSSSSPSFRSNFVNSSILANTCSSHNVHKSMSKPPLFLTNKNNVKNLASKTIPFNRSKSIATPSRRATMYMLDENYSPHRRKLWSFLHLTSKKKDSNKYKDLNFPSATSRQDFVVVEENVDSCFDGKVSRSKSVGCGSRKSFSFGDCSDNLRRVESQREGSNKMNSEDCSIKERIKCGGIFRITSSNWESRMLDIHSSNGKSKSWGWAFASPMRAFSKHSSVKKGDNSRKTDLNAIPSLLSV